MNKLALITGVDIPIPEIQTAIHQPTIKEISYMGEEEFYSVLPLFCFNKEILIAQNAQGASHLASMNNFEIFMMMIREYKNIPKENIISVFTLFFPGYEVSFLPRSLFFRNSISEHSFNIDEQNFDILQQHIINICATQSAGNQSSGFNPKDKKAAEIAAKLMKGRQRVSNSKGENNSGILSRYVSILTVALESMSLSDCLNLTICQLYDLIERYGLYVSWDLDIKSRLAGGKPDSKPDDWMKNIH